MKIAIDTTEEKYYQQVLRVIGILPPFNKLREREIEALGWFMYYYNKKLKDTGGNKQLANKLILDYDTKIEICDRMKIEMKNLYTIILGLKKNGILNKHGLHDKFIWSPNNLLSVTYNFKIN